MWRFTPVRIGALAITDAMIRDSVNQWEEINGPIGSREAAITRAALCVLRYSLGDSWCAQHLFGLGGQASYMRPQADSCPRVRPDDLNIFRYNLRIFRLAEYILNVHTVDGFSRRAERIRSGDVESGIAELEAAALLDKSGIPFRFRDESGRVTEDYDIEMVLGDTTVAVETKCKLEETVLSAGTVRDILNKARRQLPTTRPGLVFLKIPELWAVHPNCGPIVSEGLDDVLRNSRRISAVVIHWEEWVGGGANSAMMSQRFSLIHNGRARFPLTEFGDFVEPVPAAYCRSIEAILFGRPTPKAPSVVVADLAGDPVETVDRVFGPVIPGDWQVSLEEWVADYEEFGPEAMQIHLTLPLHNPAAGSGTGLRPEPGVRLRRCCRSSRLAPPSCKRPWPS